MSSLRRTGAHSRRALVIVVGLVVAIGLIAVFAGTLTRSTDIEARAERARAEIAVLEARVLAGEDEVSFLGTDDFIRQQARALGLGQRGEVPFKLPDNAPPPAVVEPIGPRQDQGSSKAPLDAWMELLFGG